MIFDCVLNYERVSIDFAEEAEEALNKYRKELTEFDFDDTFVPKTIEIHDEVEEIAEILRAVEGRLGRYPTYEEAKNATRQLGVESRKEYGERYREDPQLPRWPNRIYKGKGWISWRSLLWDDYHTLAEAKRAVSNIRIRSPREYAGRHREDPRLPGNPEEVYANKGWVNWPDFLGYYGDFALAKSVTRRLAIRSVPEYRERCHVDSKLPSSPNKVYAADGWVDWCNFFGFYATYEEGKQAAQALGARTAEEYRERLTADPRLPRSPDSIYERRGWISWPDYLGTKGVAAFKTYAKAVVAVRQLEIKSRTEYRQRRRESNGLPYAPQVVYQGKGWVGWEEFLSVPRRARECYSTYEEARRIAASMALRSSSEYKRWYKEDPKLPSAPDRAYRDRGWVGWAAFLGSEHYVTYADASHATRGLEIRSREEYQRRREEDPMLPEDPAAVYRRRGWIGWEDFVGERYATYTDASHAVRKLGIESRKEYQKRHEEDPMLPEDPAAVYRGTGWISWPDYLGTKGVAAFKTYAKAVVAVRQLEIKSRTEYRQRRRESNGLPYAPQVVYQGKGWVGWEEFLSVPRRARECYSTYEEARRIAASMALRSSSEYKRRYKEDPKLPSAPDRAYRDRGWVGWAAFLGSETRELYDTYAEAVEVVRELSIASKSEYRRRYKEDFHLPSSPEKAYREKGWTSWSEFLRR